MYFKEEIKITDEDKVIIAKLGELLCLSKTDGYFYVNDQDFFVQMGLFRSEFEEAYDKGFCKYFIHKNYYRWVTSNVINKFTGLLEALFKGLLEQFKEDENTDGILTYKNCIIAYRTYNIVTQSEQQAESDTHDVSSRILTLDEIKAYENNQLEIKDNIIQSLGCYCIRVEQQEKVDSKKKKKLIEQLRVLIYQRMCILLEMNFKRANCVEAIQYQLMLGTLIGVIDASFEPRFKKEVYERFEVARGVTVDLKSEFNYMKARYAEFKHYKKNLIRL